MMLKIIRGRQIFCSKCFNNQLLLARNRTVLTEINNAVYGSNIQWRGRSQAASVPSDVPKAKRGHKKVSKDKRHAMVESFVNKYLFLFVFTYSRICKLKQKVVLNLTIDLMLCSYRATHNGKFPTVTNAQKNVGGSFYVIRTILQELEYESKMSSSDRGTDRNLGVGVIKKNKVTVDVDVDVESQNELHKIVAQDLEIVDTSDRHLETEGGPLASSVAGRTLFEEVAKPAVHGGQSGSEDGEKEAMRTEEQNKSDYLLDPGDVKRKDKPYKGSSEPEQNAVGNSSSEPKDEVSKKSTLWGNLKSFADGFINMWKKL
ncbi:hypothetical protein Pint_16594 [Pistacia integerrima]|uniref:Uncharacterized protein n=1 Tax=Pistacia integerrima TaxID=434235 RepID=A0ACC0ZCN3_9ROSI|nr:hypothetical protein Pint_16594 [Pistacia integerrima]